MRDFPNTELVTKLEKEQGILLSADRWMFNIPIEEMKSELPDVYNNLTKQGVKTFGDIRFFSKNGFLDMRYFGPDRLDRLQSYTDANFIVRHEDLLNGTAAKKMRKGSPLLADRYPDIKKAYEKEAFENDFVRNKADAVKDTQGGCVIETFDPTDLFQMAKLEKLQQSGLVKVQYQVVLSKAPKPK